MKNMDSCSFFFFSIFIGGSVLKHAQNAYICILAYMFYLTISILIHWHIFCFCFRFLFTLYLCITVLILRNMIKVDKKYLSNILIRNYYFEYKRILVPKSYIGL